MIKQKKYIIYYKRSACPEKRNSGLAETSTIRLSRGSTGSFYYY